jgi:hypothetical protein
MNPFSILLIFCLAFPQSSEIRKQTDREHDGFLGPVKKAHEEWSPVTRNQNDIRPGTRCRKATNMYDAGGRITRSYIYAGSCGDDELREYYTYDKDGNQMILEEEILGVGSDSPPPPMPAPGGIQDQGPPKKTFKYDSQGRLTEYVVRWHSGKISYRIVYDYDAEGRISEYKSLDSAGKLNGRVTYNYEGKNRFPSKSTYFNSDGKTSQESTYSEYQINSHGDWIKRKASINDFDGVVRISFDYRDIEYY